MRKLTTLATNRLGRIALQMQAVLQELDENWPAFVYIALMIAFSIFFFRERRAEARAMRQTWAGLQEQIARLESALAKERARDSPSHRENG